VKPKQDIFCNTPWYEIQIYWDGGFGICCQESHRLYDASNHQYNIARMSIQDWFNSEPARKFRTDLLGDQPVSACSRCVAEEAPGGVSRRLRSNQKSVIFTREAFQPSFEQSPGYPNFLHSDRHDGATLTSPIDIHVDLGNFCNLACKMCNAQASSRIASQEVRWGIESSRRYLGQDWTENTTVWNSFKQQLLAIPGLNNIHFMGGETLLTHRLEDLVDTMLAASRTDLCFSFVTNGTVFRPDLVQKLRHFRRVGFEISIESLTAHNEYQRQGTDTQLVLENIQRYRDLANGTTTTVTLRPAPSALTIGSYPTLLQYALDHQLIVKSNLCTDPGFLAAQILPSAVREGYIHSYDALLAALADADAGTDYNASDPNNYRSVIRDEAVMCRNILLAPEPPDADQQQRALVQHCERWDQVYGLNARDLYPEWQDMLDRHGYPG
jgi:organic radical activating enzyme